MTNEITIPNIADVIKDKVRNVIASSIPEETLTKFVQTEFENFFKDQQERYSNHVTPSPFKRMVQEELNKILRDKVSEKIRTIVNDPSRSAFAWNDENGNRLIGSLVEEMAPAAMSGIMKGIAGQCIQALRNGGY